MPAAVCKLKASVNVDQYNMIRRGSRRAGAVECKINPERVNLDSLALYGRRPGHGKFHPHQAIPLDLTALRSVSSGETRKKQLTNRMDFI